MKEEPVPSGRWHYFCVAALSAFMATLDSSIVNVALPTLREVFKTDVKAVAWVVQSYLVVTMAFLLIGGRLMDTWGERRTFAAGFLIFTLGSAFCALSGSVMQLILSRAFQGLGAAVLMSANQGLVVRAFPAHLRGRTLGMVGTVVSVGLASGPPLGGLLIDTLGWRSIFYINVPIGLAALGYCLRYLRERSAGGTRGAFDWPGAVFIVVGLSALFIGLDRGVELGWRDPWAPGLVLGSFVVLVLFLRNESKNPAPILEIRLFLNRFFTQSCAASYLAFFSMISAIILMPFYLQEVRMYAPVKVGLFMMTLPLSMLLTAPLAGWISDQIGTRVPASFGLALVGTGLLLLHGLDESLSTLEIVSPLALIGVGMGFFGSPNSNAILSSVPREHLGIGSGISALMRTSGIAFGIAFSSTAFTFFKDRAATAMPEVKDMGGDALLYLHGIRPVFLMAAAIVGLNIINSITRGKRGKP